MPGQGMGQMIQMISVLAEMKDRKRRMALEEEQLDAQKKQFAMQFGLNEKDQTFRQAITLLTKAVDSSAESRGALGKMLEAVGAPPQMINSLVQFAEKSPEDIKTLLAKSAGRGAAAQAGTPQGAATDREAYTGAMTGQNSGQVAASGVRAGALNQSMTRFGKGFVDLVDQGAILGAVGMSPDPFGAATQMAGLATPGMPQRNAGLQYGGAMSDAASANVNLGVAAETRAASDLAARNRQFGLSLGEQQYQFDQATGGGGAGGASAINALTNAVSEARMLLSLIGSDNTSPSTRKMVGSVYNKLAAAHNLPPFTGDEKTIVQRLKDLVGMSSGNSLMPPPFRSDTTPQRRY